MVLSFPNPVVSSPQPSNDSVSETLKTNFQSLLNNLDRASLENLRKSKDYERVFGTENMPLLTDLEHGKSKETNSSNLGSVSEIPPETWANPDEGSNSGAETRVPEVSTSHVDNTASQPKESWAQKLKGNGVGKTKLRYIPPVMVNGEPVVHLQSNQFQSFQKKNEDLIIGSFVSTRLSFEFVQGIVKKAWSPKKTVIMRPYGRKSYSFKFEDPEDKAQALEYGNFHIASQFFLVRPWKLFVEADLKNMETVPIWVLFKKLPEELLDDDGLSRVASAVGEPLFTDRKTELKNKPKYARICIEVKATSTFPTVIPVVVDKKRVFRISAEYNWRPPRCTHCKVFGHSEDNCSRVQQGQKQTVWIQKKVAIENLEDNETERINAPEILEEDSMEKEDNGETTTITDIAPPPPQPHSSDNQGSDRRELDLVGDAVVSTIAPVITLTAEGAAIQVTNGFQILGVNEEVPVGLRKVIDNANLVNTRMNAFLEQNKGNNDHQVSSTVDRGRQIAGGGRGRPSGSSSTREDAAEAPSLGLRRSQRDPSTPVRLNL